MSKDIRRVHARVPYQQKIRLLGDDGRPLLVGRTMNLSPSGIYVRAPNGCEIGSEVTCDLPLPGGTRQLRGRVTRTQPLPDESTGIGIQFVDLTTGDSSSLHRALEGSGPRPVAVKVMFEGMEKPIKCHGVVTAEGIRLNTTLPFLRLGSDVKALYDGNEAQIEARGVLTGVRLEPVGSDGVPRLGVDVEIESETPVRASASSELSRDDASAGGAFTTWDPPPTTAASVEPPVVADPGLVEEEGDEVTASVKAPSRWNALAAPFERFPAWGFAIALVVAFGVVFVGINRFPPASDANRPAELAAPDPSSAPRTTAVATLQPLVVPSADWPSAAGAGAPPSASESAPAAASTLAPGTGPMAVRGPVAGAPAIAPAPAPPPAGVAGPDDADTLGAARRRGRLHGARSRSPASPSSNVRGINVPVESSSLYLEVTLPQPESDKKFGVQVTPSWPTTLAITGKSTTGFTVSFGTPAPVDAHLDWLLVR